MSFPLFDCGFTLWAADVDVRLMDRFGLTAKTLGIDPRLLRDSYYRGQSAPAAADHLHRQTTPFAQEEQAA